MKNKKLTYGLIVLAAAIWGTAGYKIIAGVSGGNAPEMPTSSVSNVKPEPVANDSFALLMKYDEPFGTVKNTSPHSYHSRRSNASSSKSSQKKKKEKDEEDAINWSFITFRGLFESSERETKTALITLKKRDYLVHEKDTIDDVIIMEIYRDSIFVKKDEHEKYIKK